MYSINFERSRQLLIFSTVAWDAMGEMTFSKRFGFLSEGEDVNGILKKAKDTTTYFSTVCLLLLLVSDKKKPR